MLAMKGRHDHGSPRSPVPSAARPVPVIATPTKDPDSRPTSVGVPIAEVSRALGVPIATLRSWERRYDMPALVRTLGRHRRYTPADLHGLRLMRDEIARGKHANVAASSVRQLLALTGPPTDFVAAILTASECSDPSAVRNQLDRAREELGLASCLDDVLLPAMQQIGSWWATGRCDIEQEHLATEAARAWLENLIAHAPPPGSAGPIVLACGPTDMHTIGLEALTVLLRYRRRACRQLGARTDVAALLVAIDASAASAVVIVSHLSSGRHRAVESIRAAAGTGTPVFYAGNAFTTPRNRRNVPGVYLGARLEDARRRIEATLNPSPRVLSARLSPLPSG
jgi:DNA-binding transcriptional MerR regulator